MRRAGYVHLLILFLVFITPLQHHAYAQEEEPQISDPLAEPTPIDYSKAFSLTAHPISKSQIQLIWDEIPGTEIYELHKNAQLLKETTKLYYTDHNLRESTDYKYTIRAKRAEGYTDFSPEIVVTTLSAFSPIDSAPPPIDPQNDYVILENNRHLPNEIPPIEQGTPFYVNGKSVAGARITVELNQGEFDTPPIETVADSEGFWDAKIETSRLEAGYPHMYQYTIEADEYTKEDVGEIRGFTVINSAAQEAEKASSNTPFIAYIIVGTLAFVILGILGYIAKLQLFSK